MALWNRRLGQATIIGSVAHRIEHLGGDQDVRSMGPDQFAKDLFAAALVVGVGGVEHVDALVQTATDHLRGPLLVHLGAEGHGAHYEPRNH